MGFHKVLASALDQNMKPVLPCSGLQEFVHTTGCFSMVKKKPRRISPACSPDQHEALERIPGPDVIAAIAV